MMKLLPVMDLYQIKLKEYRLLNQNITYPVLLINEEFILKRVPSEIVVNEVLFTSLINKGWINEIVLNKYDRIFTYYDSCFWFMMSYIKGSEFDHKNDLHFKKVNDYLSMLPKLTPEVGEIEFHDNFSIKKWYEDPEYMLTKTFTLIKHYYGQVDESYKRSIMDIFQTLEFNKNDYDKMNLVISHGEYQNTNIIFENENIKLIDWDSLSIRPQIFDVVASSCYICRDKRGDFKINPDKLREYLKCENLSDEELRNLRNMVFLTFIPKEDSIEKFYVSGQNRLKWYLNWTLDAMEKCINLFPTVPEGLVKN